MNAIIEEKNKIMRERSQHKQGPDAPSSEVPYDTTHTEEKKTKKKNKKGVKGKKRSSKGKKKKGTKSRSGKSKKSGISKKH